MPHKVNDELHFGVGVVCQQSDPGVVLRPIVIALVEYVQDWIEIHGLERATISQVAFLVTDHQVLRAVIVSHEICIRFDGTEPKAESH